MSSWKVLEANNDEETRQTNDIGSLTSLYEVVKLAIFEPDAKVTDLKSCSIEGFSDYGLVSLAINKSIFVFGENCHSLLVQININVDVDQLCWLPDGEFLLIVDREGYIHCLHIQSKFIIFKRHIVSFKKSPLSEKLVIGGKSFISPDGTISIVLISSSGQVIRLDNIEKDALLEGLRTKDVPFLQNLQDQIKTTLTDVFPDQSNVLCADCIMFSSYLKLMVWILKDDDIYCFISNSLLNETPLIYQLTSVDRCHKFISISDGRYLAVLDQDGSLSIICTESSISIWESDKDNEEKLVITDVHELAFNSDSSQLLVLTNDNDTVYLQILNVPDFNVVYKLPVNENTNLLKFGERSDCILFLEPEFSNESETIFLKLKSIVDGLPEARLAKLLQKRKFDEAEEFCGTFGLNVEDVHKSKAQYVCELLNPFRAASSNTTVVGQDGVPKHFDDLLLVLGRIEDNEFVTTLCVDALLLDLSVTKELLSYAKERLNKASRSEAGDHLGQLMQTVCKNLFCLHTFLTIFPSSDICHWIAFSRSDMLDEFLEHLKCGNLDVASTIWHRHQFEFMSKIDESCVTKILDAIPLSIPSSMLCIWLPKNILKDLVKFCPSSMESIAAWTDERIKILECQEKKLWPLNGYNLAIGTIHALDNVASEFLAGGSIEIQMAVHLAQLKAHSPSSCLFGLRQTAIALADLQILSQKFNVKISYNTFTQDCKSSVTGAIFDWLLCGEDVAPLMDGFLRSYLVRHNLDSNLVLANYVQQVLESSYVSWWLHEEAPWEDKVYAIVKLISDAEIQAKCIVDCVRLAPAPWSEGTAAMCNLGMALETNYTQKLKVQQQLSKLKIVLRRYDLHRINFEDLRNGELILRNITSREGPGVLEDAQIVVAVFKNLKPSDAFFHRCLYLISLEKFAETKVFLNSLSKSDLVIVSNMLVSYLLQQLQLLPRTPKCRQKLQNIVGVFLSLETLLTDNCSKGYLNDCSWPEIRRLHLLQTKYNIYLTLDDLNNHEVGFSTLKDYIINLFISKQEELKNDPSNMKTQLGISTLRVTHHHKSGLVASAAQTKNSLTGTKIENNTSELNLNLPEHMGKLQHLASLLGVSRENCFTLLGSLASKSGYLEEAVYVTKLLEDEVDVQNLSPVVNNIIQMVSQNQEKNKKNVFEAYDKATQNSFQCRSNLILILPDLLGKTLVTCSSDEISNLCDLGLWCQISKILFNQCHKEGIYTSPSQNSSEDILDDTKLTHFFSDPSVPIEKSFVIEALSIILKQISLKQRIPGHVYSNCNVVSAIGDLIIHLKERSQDLLALNISLLMTMNSKLSNIEEDLPNSALNLRASISPSNITTLFMKLISSPNQDKSLAVALLTTLKAKESLKVLNDVIKRLGYDFARLLNVGKMGKTFCRLNAMREIEMQFSILTLRASWGKTLESMNISFKNAFSGDKEALLKSFDQMVLHERCSFPMVYEFCNDFSLDVNNALCVYLKQSIRQWQPIVKENCLTNQNHRPIIDQMPQSLVYKIKAIVSRITDPSMLLRTLETEFGNLSSYNYEMLDLVLNRISFIEDCDQDAVLIRKNILDFLKLYERQKPPAESELTVWQDKNVESESLPLICNYRLPFHELCCTQGKEVMINIVKQELTLQMIDRWIKMAKSIQINPDQLYFLTVANTIKKDSNLNGRWHLTSTPSALLDQIKDVISKIQYPELSTACAHYVVTKLPSGTDKVFAAKLCSSVAQRWKSTSDDPKASDAANKYVLKHQQLAVENALHKFNLAQPEYLSLTKDVRKLIHCLYEHPCISSLTTVGAEDVPDINGCVTEICTVMQINQESLQRELLQEWLPLVDNSGQDNLDDTVSNFHLILHCKAPEEETSKGQSSLSRVIYLLRCYPEDAAACYLLHQALTKDENVSTKVKLNALKCLLAIADKDVIQKHSEVPFQDFRLMLQTLTYVSRLESLGHPTSISLFESMDKNALVEGLWRSQRHNPEAILLLVDICCDFKISTSSLWGAVLNQLTKFAECNQLDLKTLERVLLQIKNAPHLWLLDQLKNAWHFVISTPFKKADAPATAEDLSKCIHSVNLLVQYCPVNISVDVIMTCCDALELPLLALAAAASQQNKNTDLSQLVDKFSKKKLLAQYEETKLTLVIPKSLENILESFK